MAEDSKELVHQLSAVVKEKAEAKDGFKLTVEIPSFKSKYPTILTRVPPAEAAKLIIGQPVNLRLKRGGLKEGKDGSLPWHYWWDFVAIADSAAAPEPEKLQPAPDWDARQASIQRQTAFKGAVELVCAMLAKDKLPTGQKPSAFVRDLTDYFEEVIQNVRTSTKAQEDAEMERDRKDLFG